MPKLGVNAWYGWRRDRPDFRDHRLQLAPGIAIADHVDLRPGFPAPYNQGSLGSCTANAIAGLLEFNQRLQKQKAPFTPSRLYIYYREREIEGSIREDAGAEIRDGMKVVNQFGAPREKTWPYVINRFARKPTKAADKEAQAHQSILYSRVIFSTDTPEQRKQKIMQCLSAGFPIAFGFSCFKCFDSDETAKTGLLDMPGLDEKDEGGHAVDIVGYTHDLQLVHSLGTKLVIPDWAKRFDWWTVIRNSWDTDWGDKGYFYMPGDYICHPQLASDFWTIKSVE